ncbi:MAG: hypothetical protein LBV73_11620 [Paraburkholderia sp.]|nr:hypothetical protein [Paraburkholderia sp.]
MEADEHGPGLEAAVVVQHPHRGTGLVIGDLKSQLRELADAVHEVLALQDAFAHRLYACFHFRVTLRAAKAFQMASSENFSNFPIITENRAAWTRGPVCYTRYSSAIPGAANCTAVGRVKCAAMAPGWFPGQRTRRDSGGGVARW